MALARMDPRLTPVWSLEMPKSRFFAHHPQTERRLGPRSLRMTPPTVILNIRMTPPTFNDTANFYCEHKGRDTRLRRSAEIRTPRQKGEAPCETSPWCSPSFGRSGSATGSHVGLNRWGGSFELRPSFPPLSCTTLDARVYLLPFVSFVTDSLEGHRLPSPFRKISLPLFT
jgi:hypothetical protein